MNTLGIIIIIAMAAEFILNCLYKWKVTDPDINQRYDYWLTNQATMFYTGTWMVGASLKQKGMKVRTDVMPILVYVQLERLILVQRLKLRI